MLTSPSSPSSSNFKSHALLRLEEAKQILIDVESMQTVGLPRLHQEKSQYHESIQKARLELNVIGSQIDQAKNELNALNNALQQQKASRTAATADTCRIIPHDDKSSSTESNLDSPALFSQKLDVPLEDILEPSHIATDHGNGADSAAASPKEGHNVVVMMEDVAMELEANRESTTMSSSSSLTTSSLDSPISSASSSTNNKDRVYRRRRQRKSGKQQLQSPKKWRRMIRTHRLQSIWLGDS
ncbi:hypothetical protein ACA910_013594 [Epithemia clementina (nom. ined.)]